MMNPVCSVEPAGLLRARAEDERLSVSGEMKTEGWVRTSAEEFSIYVENSQLGQVSSTLAAPLLLFPYIAS